MPPRAFYNEFDPNAAAWLRELIRQGLIADGDVDERSILDVQPDDLKSYTQCHFFAGIGGWSYALRLAGWPDDRPVWTGSPPCQPFSMAGRRKGKDDDRHLAPHFISLVRACRPDVLFGEQVASSEVFGGATKAARGKAAEPPRWAWLDDLSDRLEAARYAVGASDIPSAGVGAPHIRQRTFFGAIRLADADQAGRGGQREDDHGCTEMAVGSQAGASAHVFGRGALGGLADADGRDSGAEGLQRSRKYGQQSQDRGTGRLADAHDAGSQGRVSGRSDQGREGESRHLRRGGAVGGMADAEVSGRGQGVSVNRGLRSGDSEEGASRRSAVYDLLEPIGLAEATGAELEAGGCEPRGNGGSVERPERLGEDGFLDDRGWACPDYGPWGIADWLYCRDGKWRPVESKSQQMVDGLPDRVGRSGNTGCPDYEEAWRCAEAEIGFPLGHGSVGRVARLRGYGNAINPWAAKEFIEAFDAAIGDDQGDPVPEADPRSGMAVGGLTDDPLADLLG